MRTRKEVEENIRQHDLDYQDAEALRLLLDIRELLANPPVEILHNPIKNDESHGFRQEY